MTDNPATAGNRCQHPHKTAETYETEQEIGMVWRCVDCDWLEAHVWWKQDERQGA